jgi:sulfate adenylyltransferase subunit 2
MTNSDVSKRLLANRYDPTGNLIPWDTKSVHEVLIEANPGQSVRTTERYISGLGILPVVLSEENLVDEFARPAKQQVFSNLLEQCRRQRWSSYFVQIHRAEDKTVLFFNDSRVGRRWLFLSNPIDSSELVDAILSVVVNKSVMIWPQADLVAYCRRIVAGNRSTTIPVRKGVEVNIGLGIFSEPAFKTAALAIDLDGATQVNIDSSRIAASSSRSETNVDKKMGDSRLGEQKLTHLDRLEAESMHIMREVMSLADNPVMLYSIGKDSSVMLHLAKKAFYPSPPPFPLLHVDTQWKFQAMYDFREQVAKNSGMEMLVFVNPQGKAKNINPLDHGSALHTDIMKTEGLKLALDKYQFDVAFGGARRDEEQSRAKERVFSFRSEVHRWDPKNQRPELWNLYNAHKKKGESIRVFPLSNWTELDIWQYIYKEQIDLVPLYFAAERPIVDRDGLLLMVDDDRLKIGAEEKVEMKKVRFRTLGCYPLSGAVESDSEDLPSIILELLESRTSERQGRAIDSDSAGSMEKKKQEGYF